MKSSKPPALATWLLEHVIPSNRNEALAGDLLEQFRQGHSATWYWRQVLVAIFLGFSMALNIVWMAASSAILWTAVLVACRQSVIHLMRTHRFEAVFARELSLGWPLSLVAPISLLMAMGLLPVVTSLVTYLLVTKSLSLYRFARGLTVGLVVLPIAFIGVTLLPMRGVVGSPIGDVRVSLPLFFTLLLSMWTAGLRRSAKATVAISA